MTPSVARIAVVYYSSTGHVHQLATALEAGARDAGARTRLRRAAELAPEEAVASNPAWAAHLAATADVAEATHDDLEWATGFAFGTPARYGLPAAQLKQFVDTLAPLWHAGALRDKAATAFTSSQNDHGGQESTLLALCHMFFHWGALIVGPDSSAAPALATGGNPYGTSYPSGDDDGRVPGAYLAAARAQGARLADVAIRLGTSGRAG